MTQNKSQDEVIVTEIRTDEYEPKRVFTGWGDKIITIIAVSLSLFQLYTALFGSLDAVRQRSVHFAGLFALMFLFTPAFKDKAKSKGWLAFDIFLVLCSLFVGAYAFLFYNKVAMSMMGLAPMDVVVGVMAILLVLEGSRRVVGLPLTIISLVFLAYAFFGRYMPMLIAFKGANLTQVAYQMFFTTEGIFSVALGISATYVAVFVLFGAFLKASGVGDCMVDLAHALIGHVRGGAAKIAVVASSFFGTISGSSVANVVGTGTFTIPLMKSIGYPGHFAGAVEAVASTGGQIMPPVMGAAAFLIAETMGTNYWNVVKAAIVPAILYYLAVFIMVDIEAVKRGIKGLPREQLPKLGAVLKRSWLLFLSVGVLLYCIGVAMMSAQRAAFIAIAVLFVGSLFTKKNKIGPKQCVTALRAGAVGMIDCAIACAGAGIIIGVITLSGMGLRLSSIMIQIANGNLPILMILTMIAAIILGMGVPATAAYILVSVIIAPAMISLGVAPMAAYLFVFYFSIVSMITPPVALAAYAGAGIAKANPMKTGYTATWLGLSGFIVPYVFVANPGLLGMGGLVKVITAILSGVSGVSILAFGLQGFLWGKLSIWERLLCFGTTLLLLDPGLLTDTIGYGLALTFIVCRYFIGRRSKANPTNLAAEA